MTCPHNNFAGDVNVGRITREEGGPVEAFVADVSIKCADCGIAFEVCWTEDADPHVIPMSIDPQKKRPWVSGLGTLMGWCLKPMEPAEEMTKMPNVGYGGSA